MADGTAITDTFTLSVYGSDPLGPFPAGTVASPRVADSTRPASSSLRRRQLDGGNVGAVEIEVFG